METIITQTKKITATQFGSLFIVAVYHYNDVTNSFDLERSHSGNLAIAEEAYYAEIYCL